MDFKLSYEQEAIQKAAEEFARGEFDKEIALEHEKAHTFPYEIWKKACELGFVGIHYPEEYGGQEYGVLENALVVEAFCRQDSGLGIALSNADSSAEMILRHGGKEQKEKYLTPVARGEAISSGAFTEPDHGSDITGLSTTAVKDGNDFVINGSKTFITNGPISSFVIVLCQTNPASTPAYRGQSAIIVDTKTPGFTVSDIGEKMGNKMAPTGELSFNDVRAPLSNLVGKENNGFYQAMELFEEIRIEVAAQALGIAQGAFDRALAHVKERKQFGKRLEEFQVTRHKLADMLMKIETARLIVYKAAWNFDQGTIDPRLTSMAKVYAGRVAVEVADEALQLHGGYGYMLEYEVERFYRDARLTEIYGGTKEIQKNTIANSLLEEIRQKYGHVKNITLIQQEIWRTRHTMRKSGLYDTIFWVALGTFVSVYSYVKLGIGKLNAPGSGLMPFLLGLLFGLLALYKLVTRILRHTQPEEKPGEEKEDDEQKTIYKKVIMVVAALFTYAILLEPLGFILTTFLTMTLLFRSAGFKRWGLAVAYSAGVVLITYFLFTYLGVRFPPGILRALGLN